MAWQEFIDIGLKEFDFLVKDFSFTATPETVCGVGLSFARDANDLKISFGWYKGEVDFQFEVLVENNVFRPYISRRFDLWEVVDFIDPDGIKKVTREGPPLPRCILSTEDARRDLHYRAMLVQKFCMPIVSGDFEVLEAIVWARRRDAE